MMSLRIAQCLAAAVVHTAGQQRSHRFLHLSIFHSIKSMARLASVYLNCGVYRGVP
jgi:hypothetical protein